MPIILSKKAGGGGSGGGVTSFSESGQPALTGAVTLSEGAGVSLTQSGQDIAVSSTFSGCIAYRNGTFSHNTSGSWMFPDLDAELLDTAAYHGATPSRITVPAGLGGVFQVTALAWWDTDGTGSRGLGIDFNGASDPGYSVVGNPNTNIGERQIATAVVQMAAGEYVRLGLFQNSGGTRTVGHATIDGALMLQVARLGA